MIINGMYYHDLKPPEECIERLYNAASKEMFSMLVDYQPGNATRYVVHFTWLKNSGDMCTDVLMNVVNFRHSMELAQEMHADIDINYMVEKLGMLPGDCYALTFLTQWFYAKLREFQNALAGE